jgi:hypothetical protein
MRSDGLSRRKFAVAMAVLGLTACGLTATPVASKVIVDQLQTDVVFGAGQPTPQPSPAIPQPLGLGLSQVPIQYFTGGTLIPQTPYSSCPVAPSTAFPTQPATTDVTVKPATGAYSSVASGSYDYSPIPTVTTQPPVLPTFTEIVRNVATFSDMLQSLPGSTQGLNFTYETVQPQLGNIQGGYYVFHWRVKANPQAGDPAGGLSLYQVQTLDAKRSNPKTVFDAGSGPGLLILPLPAQPGTVGPQTPNGGQGPAVSVDTSGSNNTMVFQGTVGSRERVDVCGTWLQAWPVDGSLQTGSATAATVHLDVATQFGAIVIAFDIDGSFLGTNYHKLATHFAQPPPPGPTPPEWQS